jgi:translation initiation factor IF-2
LAASIMPSELANVDEQIVPLTATLVAGADSPEEWAYDMLFSVSSEVEGVVIDSVVATETGATANLIFPAGVVEGDSATVTCQTGGRVASLVVAVESYA